MSKPVLQKQKPLKFGNWIFEPKPNNQFFARKARFFGDSYVASLVVTIKGNKAMLDLYCNKYCDSHTRSDHADFNDFLKSQGCDIAVFERFKNGKKQLVTKQVI